MKFDVIPKFKEIERHGFSEASVFYIEKYGGKSPFFVDFSKNTGSERGFVQRPTDAQESDFRSFTEEFMGDPEFSGEKNDIYAHGDDFTINYFGCGLQDGGILTYRSDLKDADRIKDFYIEGSEPLTREEYEDVIESGLNDLEELFRENEVEL